MSLSIELIQGKASIGHTEHPAGQSEYQPLDLLLHKEKSENYWLILWLKDYYIALLNSNLKQAHLAHINQLHKP